LGELGAPERPRRKSGESIPRIRPFSSQKNDMPVFRNIGRFFLLFSARRFL